MMHTCTICNEAQSWNPLTDGTCDDCWEKHTHCPRCTEDYTDEDGNDQKGTKELSECLDCGVCSECEHLSECSNAK